MELDLLTVVFLAFFGFVAAFIDSTVGGGGLISLPALLGLGMPPYLALGTNKLAARFPRQPAHSLLSARENTTRS